MWWVDKGGVLPTDSLCIPLGKPMEPDTRKLTSLSVWASVGQWTTQLDPTELIGSEQITNHTPNGWKHGKIIHGECIIFSPKSP